LKGELLEDEIIITDEKEASQIYNKGYFGIPQPGGALKLSLIEAIYLQDVGRLQVKRKGRKVSEARLMRLANLTYQNFEIKYIVYRDLRQRGYVVKPHVILDFRVFPRGGAPNKTPSKYWVWAISERGILNIEDLVRYLNQIVNIKKELLLGVVDEESDLTYYKVRKVRPRGKIKRKKVKTKIEAIFLGDRVMVLDEEKAQALHDLGFYGKLIGDNLQLSLLESAYLLENDVIIVKDVKTGRKMSVERFLKRAKNIQQDIELRMQIYKDLRNKGIIVKTGFKYGSHFRAYEGDPEVHHAKYLVHAVPKNFKSMWPEISRAVRLAHGVKKELLFGRQNNEKVEYIRLRRIRP
jgi:tRNA-intron endonuclease